MAKAWLALFIVMGAGVGLFECAPAWAQVSAAEVQALKDEIQKLTERLMRLEQSARPAAPVAPAAPAVAPQPTERLSRIEQASRAEPVPALAGGPVPVAMQTPAPIAPRPGEREILLQEREHPFELLGLGKPEIGGVRISGFFVGSANFNSRIQMVPEFAGTAPASSEPGRSDFRFDQFAIGAFKTFAPWLSAGASVEIERHGHRHSHGFDPDFGCPAGGTLCVEQFGSETMETEVSLHRFNITGVAPIGNGLSLSFGRFDVPFGYERHDAPLNLTATTSELQRFGRPMSMTGFLASYQFAPWLDASAWIVNRWENETTEDPLEDNNRDKSIGGRIGFTPLHGNQLLNFGIGGWWGAEQEEDSRHNRWIIDADVTWSPMPRLLLTSEFVYGGESGVSFRPRGVPFPAPAETDRDVNWLGFYALAHYDVTDWLGMSFRYGLFKDYQGARTGVAQLLQSFTFTPIVHLSRLIPDLRPLGVTYTRTRHPLDWVDVRLEYRLDTSDKPVFSDARPGTPITEASRTGHAVTVQFVVNY